MRDQLESLARQTGRRSRRLDELPPSECEHLWLWFLELGEGRGSSGFGANPISWQDIAAWTALTGVTPRPEEVRVLMRLDRAWMAHTAKPGPA